jgi:thermitase
METVAQGIISKHGGSEVQPISRIGAKSIKVPAGELAKQLQEYQNDKAVEYAEPDFIVKAIGAPDDPTFDEQGCMTVIQAPEAWDITRGNKDIIIAILDSGIDQDHEDLASKIVANQNFTDSPTVDDMLGHGTHVAGIAAAITNNGIGVAGVGFDSSLMNVKVLDDSGIGYNSWIAEV